jgi:Nif-specific regulatory protein
MPGDLLAEALDRGHLISAGPWVAAPLTETGEGYLLTIHRPRSFLAATDRELIDELAQILGQAIRATRRREQADSRLARLDAMLQIAARWNQFQETEPLLVEIAQAACRLLGADRASIFLWDRHSRTLVAKPALGVGGEELRVPEDAGIVGQVVQTGQSRRVNSAADQAQIDRSVDRQLGYVTRSLLCVPLVGRNATRLGAFEMVNKLRGDFTADDEEALRELAAHAAVALENARNRESLLRSQKQVADQAAAGVELIGESPPIAALRSTLSRVADTELAILILGENGTGKEVVARLIHYRSRRRGQPFIAVNCAAITETLLESELFGHEKGAFTDAREARPGKFELASGGTLFLDEIAELSLAGQAKLLRVLEEKLVVRVGGSLPVHTDVRVLAATNRDLADMVRQRRFREDLFFRLNVVSLELPPLRERGPDALLLAEHFLEQFARRIGRATPRLSESARRRLLEHSWPGNVRELRNLMERIAYLSPSDTVEAEDLAFILTPLGRSAPLVPMDLELAEATDRFQAQYIKQAIDGAGGNMSQAASRLGLHRSNLYRKMRQLGMNISP